MKAGIQLRVTLDEPQSEQLQQRMTTLPFKVGYQEEQHGPQLIAVISCTPSQEKTIREMLADLGTRAAEWTSD
jgi:hypothetical protein